MEILSHSCESLNHQKARKIIFLSAFIALFLWAFIFAASAQAQEADTTAPPADASGEEILTEEEISSEEAFSEEALQDFNVTIEDMKANRATIMPDSPFHVFKRFGRAVTETFTFNPVAKAELRMEHANDMLAETMQMIDEDGMQRVNHSAVITAIERYEGKLGQVAGQIEDVKAEKETQTEAVDAFLDNFIDKQLKQQKVLDSIAEDVIDVKESGVEVELAMEQIMATVEDVKGQTMTSFTNVLSGVEDTPEDMATRLSTVMDNQEGSDFKHLKNLEVLGAVYDKVPATAKEAINQAKENTKKKLEVRINTLPPAVRADKFQKYVENATVDETRLITLLDELKQSTGIPADILAKLEEAKEIAVRKFEKRLDYIDDFAIEQRYFDRFDSTQVDGLIAMEEFKNRMSKDSKSGQRMAQAHDESVGVFKKMFTDVDSQYQAEKFQMLTEEMMRNPSPKTFKLLQQLEEEVMADPQKKAFLAQTEVAMKNQFETRFRREGDMFMDRISSLDPNDIGILEGFDFGNDFNGRFVEKNTEQFQNYMQAMDDPRNFDMFRDRFSNTSEFVINEIKTKDAGFQDSMMFKMRKMEEVRFEKERQIQTASIDYQERELNFQMDRVQMQKEDEFWQKLNALPPDAYDARKQLWEQKINDQYTLVEQRFNEQKKLFDARLANDPFCDAVCKQIQLQFMDQQQRQEKTRMSDDLVRERNRIEAQKVQQQNNNPLAGKCNTPEQCDSYCQAHAGEQGCQWVMMQTNMPQACPAASFWDFNKKQCVYPQDMSAQDMQNQGMRPDDMYQPVDMARYEFHSCAQGEFWDDMRQSCMFDPYFRAPTKFQNCGFGQHWNDMRGFCEQDKVQCMTFVQVRDCNPGERSTPPDPKDQCGQPSCIPKTQFCADISASMPVACPSGQRRETIIGPKGCPKWGACVDTGGEQWNDCPANYEPVCGINSKTYDNECQAKSFGIGIQYYGGCESSGFHDCPWGQFWEQSINKCLKETDYVPFGRPGQCDFGWKWIGEYCARDAGVVGTCDTRCEPKCADRSFCIFDNKGCATGCSPACAVGEFYDQWQGSCISSQMNTICGNGVCEGNEYCPQDCESSPTSPPPTGMTCPSTRFNDFKTTPACDYGECPQGCVFGSMGCPTGCSGTGGGYCGDNLCGSEETMMTCPSDCGAGAMTCDNDGICESNETSSSCPSDCGATPTTGYCGDGMCNNGEAATSCPEDCMTTISCSSVQANGFTKSKDCNFNACASGCNFDSNGCPTGCKTSGGICPTNSYNNYEGSKNCSSVTCPNGCTFNTSGCPTGCQAATPTSTCGNGTCDSTETASSCAFDCGTTSTTPPSSGGAVYCGNNICESSETMTSCPGDCGGGMTACDNDGICDFDESMTSCPSDCVMTGDMSIICGDGTCTAPEDSYSCPVDCGTAPPPSSGWCGDGMCDSGETSTSCASDCGATEYYPPPLSSWCGDGTCDSSETPEWCPEDCGTVMGASTKRDIVSKYNPFNLLKPIMSFFSSSN